MSWNKLVSEVQAHNRYLIDEIKEKNNEILRLREALEFYADKSNYEYSVDVWEEVNATILEDDGEKARQALGVDGG
ncbi:hypothetical protein ACFFF5_21130 [Lederbergia wuyishanensis]|uniref:Signal transduction histidine kinase n=1 Tax=Lederbergia wuyishanensis TaxID=1347903 RepID=A0ABU0D7C6_9BACI|nr:hypothetical protein [Lederbergia wuyishanensis]MCJ8008920.1 hypothetical protein [Lederbergia wuyishanensis]MDQ0344246.1 signal transduction histidine kinase [Lederbergia wuyishanensis]